MSKLSPNFFIAIFFSLILFGLFVMSGRISLEAVQKALSVDESSAISDSAQLNKSTVEKAIALVEKNGKIIVSSKNSVVSSQEKEEETEKEEEEEKEEIEPEKVEIINSSGINGAAGRVGTVFSSNVKVSLRNGEEILDETLLFYKNEYKGLKEEIEKKLNEEGFTLDDIGILEDDEEYDIKVILSK